MLVYRLGLDHSVPGYINSNIAALEEVMEQVMLPTAHNYMLTYRTPHARPRVDLTGSYSQRQ